MTSGFRDPSGHFVDRLFRPETRDGVSTGSGSDWVAVDSKDRDCQDCYPVANAPGTDLILRSRRTSYTLIAAIRSGLKVGTRAVIKPVDLFLHLSRKTDSMQFVTAPQPPYGFTYFADFPTPRAASRNSFRSAWGMSRSIALKSRRSTNRWLRSFSTLSFECCHCFI